jgi:hypothetical protein
LGESTKNKIKKTFEINKIVTSHQALFIERGWIVNKRKAVNYDIEQKAIKPQ